MPKHTTQTHIIKTRKDNKWMEETLFSMIIDTPYNTFILPYQVGIGKANYQNNPQTQAYYVDIPDNTESTKIRMALYIKSLSTTLWIRWQKALQKTTTSTGEEWKTISMDREIRHINLGFYEEWLYTDASMRYLVRTYTQTFTKIYIVAKPDFVIKPDTEYVVIILRVGDEFRTIVCPKTTFLESRLGDIIMGTKSEELGDLGLGDAEISGFGEGKISPYIYGLITKNDATVATWNRVVEVITQNASGAEIASMEKMDRILVPKDVARMIPLSLPPQQGESLPEYLSPEAPIWATITGIATEAGRMLCRLFLALADFLAKFLETIEEWGLKLLGTLLQVLDDAKYLFAMALCVWSWVETADFIADFGMLLMALVGFFVFFGTVDIGPGYLSISAAVSDAYFNFSIEICTIIFYDFPIASLHISIGCDAGAYGYSFLLDSRAPFVPFIRSSGSYVVSNSARWKSGQMVDPYIVGRNWSYRESTDIIEDFLGKSWPELVTSTIITALGSIIFGLGSPSLRIYAVSAVALGFATFFIPIAIALDKAYSLLIWAYFAAVSLYSLIGLFFVLPIVAGCIFEKIEASHVLSIMMIMIYSLCIIAGALFGVDEEFVEHLIVYVWGIFLEIYCLFRLEKVAEMVEEKTGIRNLIESKKKPAEKAAIPLTLLAGLSIIMIFTGMFLDLGMTMETDTIPPNINMAHWDIHEANNDTTVTFSINIEEQQNVHKVTEHGEISSHITDFGIIVIEKDPNGDFGASVNPYGRDPLSDEDYKIPINFMGLIGTTATTIQPPVQWGGEDHEYNISFGDVSGSGWLVRGDDRHAFVNGTITFSDWEPKKYYIIVWAVDEWGNARYVFYNVSIDPVARASVPRPQNLKRMIDCDPDLWSYYYEFNKSYYAPCFLISRRVHRGFSMIIPNNASLISKKILISSSRSVWGLFIYHYEWFFRTGDVWVSGYRIVFHRDPILPVFFWDGLLVTLLFYYVDKRLLLFGDRVGRQ